LKLLEQVSTLLARHGIGHAVIGAAALATHGVTRATLDLDLLAVDRACLDGRIWEDLRATGTRVEIRRGDDRDPLAVGGRADRGPHRGQERLAGRSPVASDSDASRLPEECTELWQRIRSQRERGPRRPGGPIS
jgi:hypothetical protein